MDIKNFIVEGLHQNILDNSAFHTYAPTIKPSLYKAINTLFHAAYKPPTDVLPL
jgi:hypothetical protein